MVFVDLFTEKQLDDEKDLILDTLRDHEDGLRLEDVCISTDLPDHRTHEVLCELAERGLVRFTQGAWCVTRKGM